MSDKKIDVKIGTPVEAKWKEILLSQEESLVANKINQEIAEMVIDRAKFNIKAEKLK